MPEHVGLPAGTRRRTPGLRREEIAVLAGLSPTWYTYLEQGRDIKPSAQVLESLSRVLQLTDDERRYLYLLALGPAPPAAKLDQRKTDMAVLQNMIDMFQDLDYPVYAGNVYGDVLAWNTATSRWYTDFGAVPEDHRNMLRWLLTAPEARERVVDWAEDVRDVIGRFRIASAARPWDRRFAETTATLYRASPTFRRWWKSQDVHDQHTRVRRLRTADGSALAVQLVTLRMTDDINSVILHVPADPGADAVGGAARNELAGIPTLR
jgi:transcriptional regulator with XRE-family HTH domain